MGAVSSQGAGATNVLLLSAAARLLRRSMAQDVAAGWPRPSAGGSRDRGPRRSAESAGGGRHGERRAGEPAACSARSSGGGSSHDLPGLRQLLSLSRGRAWANFGPAALSMPRPALMESGAAKLPYPGAARMLRLGAMRTLSCAASASVDMSVRGERWPLGSFNIKSRKRFATNRLPNGRQTDIRLRIRISVCANGCQAKGSLDPSGHFRQTVWSRLGMRSLQLSKRLPFGIPSPP